MRYVIIPILVLITSGCVGRGKWCTGEPLKEGEWCEQTSRRPSRAAPVYDGREIISDTERAQVIGMETQKNNCIKTSRSNDELISCLQGIK
jgi:hypothetical protein